MNQCGHCGKDGASKRCSKCQSVFYCDRDCQLAGWKSGHKKTCGLWTTLTNIPPQAGGGQFVMAAGCYKNNLILVRGVEPGRGNCECWNYDIDTKKWTKRKNPPICTRAADGFVVENFMYVFDYTSSEVRTLCLDLENKTKQWEGRASLYSGIRVGASITTDGKSYIYLSGGYHPSPQRGEVTVSTVDRYDIANDKWERNWSNMPTPRHSHSSVVANDHLYILGGRNEEFELSSPSLAFQDPTQQLPICNLKNNTWSLGSPLPVPSSDDMVYLWRGRYLITFPLTSRCTLIFDTLKDKWSISKIHQNTQWVNQKCCSLPNGRLALLGGMDAFMEIPNNWSDKVTTIDVDEILKTSRSG